MSLGDSLRFVLRWGLTGSVVLTIYLVVMWQLGYLGAVRNDQGELRRHMPKAGLLTGIGSILMYIVLIVVADLSDLFTPGTTTSFFDLMSVNYLVYLFWLLFDTLVIDILLVGLWHPGFLRLPEREAHGSAIYHLRTIPQGMMIGIVVVLIASGIAQLLSR
jgi:hypothetical protein